MGVGIGQLKSEGHFFLAAKENKFYSPGTTQQFLLWSVKHSQKSVGVLAEKGTEFQVELVGSSNALACNMLQICAWAGMGQTSWFMDRPWTMGFDGLYTYRHGVSLGWYVLPHRYIHHTHWRALAGRRADGWLVDSEMIYCSHLPMEGHPDFRCSHGSSHTDPKEQPCPWPAHGGDRIQPACCSWRWACLPGSSEN